MLMQEPKRRYVLTRKGRKAVLANLQKARQADPRLIHRPTPRRLEALWRNLIKAVAANAARRRWRARMARETRYRTAPAPGPAKPNGNGRGRDG